MRTRDRKVRMFERFTIEARRAVFFARYEASVLGSTEIECTHMLLGLLREARSMLQGFAHMSLDLVRKQIEETAEKAPSQHISTSVDMPLSRSLKRALAYASRATSRYSRIEVGHLVLGLLHDEGSQAAHLLNKYGITRDLVLAKLGEKATPGDADTKPTEMSLSVNGHEVVVAGRLILSEDGRTLTFNQEVSGPGKTVNYWVDFDLP
jgi:ATP-dependent Clp protease ATP-binding subunit ClpA